jgi:hypothetical protein
MQPALMTEQDVANAAKRLPFMQFPERGLYASAILARLSAWASVGKTPANVVQIRTAALKAQQEYREWQQRQEKSRNWTETSGELSTSRGSEMADRINLIGSESSAEPSITVPTIEPLSDPISSSTPKPGQPSSTRSARAALSNTALRKK